MISERMIFRLKNIGSRNAEKSAPVERVLSATATFETFMAPKKAIQCNPMITPIPKSIAKSFELSFKLIFLIFKIKNKTTAATKTLYQTRGTASTSMSLPKTPVNPHKRTMNCKRNCAAETKSEIFLKIRFFLLNFDQLG